MNTKDTDFDPETETIVLKKDISEMRQEIKRLKRALERKDARYKKVITYLKRVVEEFEQG